MVWVGFAAGIPAMAARAAGSMALIHKGEATPITSAKTAVGHKASRSRQLTSGREVLARLETVP